MSSSDKPQRFRPTVHATMIADPDGEWVRFVPSDVDVVAHKGRELAGCLQNAIDDHSSGSMTAVKTDLLKKAIKELCALPSYGAPSERTPADFAIEFGEYLAQAAEGFMETANRLAALEGENEQVIEAARQGLSEAYSDHFKGLRSAVYEFRKRAERAKAARSETANIVQVLPLTPQPETVTTSTAHPGKLPSHRVLEFAAKHFEQYGLSHLQIGEPWTGIGLAEALRACAPSAGVDGLPSAESETACRDDFHGGTLAALDIVYLHDLETIAAEIVNATDHEGLLRYAIREGYVNLAKLKATIRRKNDVTRR